MEPVQSKFSNLHPILIKIKMTKNFVKKKREKVNQIDKYPFLVPKSYELPFNIDYKNWLTDQLYSCDIQVIYFLI
jgi:hypothetical protein